MDQPGKWCSWILLLRISPIHPEILDWIVQALQGGGVTTYQSDIRRNAASRAMSIGTSDNKGEKEGIWWNANTDYNAIYARFWLSSTKGGVRDANTYNLVFLSLRRIKEDKGIEDTAYAPEHGFPFRSFCKLSGWWFERDTSMLDSWTTRLPKDYR